MKRPKDEYTYLEWVIGIRFAIDMYCDMEVCRISHDAEDERPRKLIQTLRSHLNAYEKQIPDEIID